MTEEQKPYRVLVTDEVDPEGIALLRAAQLAGFTDLGESYAQELLAKRAVRSEGGR